MTMNIGAFEMWESDKQLLEYMLDRCIVAKLIESTSNVVPDNYSYYFEGQYGMNSFPYFETIQDFLSLTKIGKLEFRELSNSEYSGHISIQLFALEELAHFPLTSMQCETRDKWMRNFTYDIETLDYSTIEGKCNAVGTRLIIQLHYSTGLANELCEYLLSIHKNANEMIRKLRRNSKGESNNANNS